MRNQELEVLYTLQGRQVEKFSLHVRTGWNLTYKILKKACRKMRVLMPYSITHNETVGLLLLTRQIWRVTEVFRDFLRVFSDATVPFLDLMSAELANKGGDSFFNEVIMAMKAKLLKYYKDIPPFFFLYPLFWIRVSSWRDSKLSLFLIKKVWGEVRMSKSLRYWRRWRIGSRIRMLHTPGEST